MSRPAEVERPVPAAATPRPAVLDPATPAADRPTDVESPTTAPPIATSESPAPAAPLAADEPPAPTARRSDRDPASVEGWLTEWPLLIEAVGRSDAPLAGVLRDCRPVEAAPGRLAIGTKGSFHYDRIRDEKKTAVLREAVAAVAGRQIDVETRFIGEPRAEGPPPGSVSDATEAVLKTFVGSRVTSTRIRERPQPQGPHSPAGG
jgi:hypothetical protein